jgi:signal transduction histidine kinase
VSSSAETPEKRRVVTGAAAPCVLVMDDRATNREPLVALLRDAGHRTLEASDYHDALETIKTESPDLIVTDILMSHTDGYEFVRHLRAQTEIDQPRVVFCTATYLVGQALEMAQACGITHVVERTADPAVILSTITAALDADVELGEFTAEEFDRNQMRLLSQKLLYKVEELEAANLERGRLVADLVNAQEHERSRIASEIHDDSIQVMSAVALRLEMLGEDLADPDQREAVAKVAEKVAHAVGRVRRLIFDLSPRSLESGGLGSAIESYLREVGTEAGFTWHVEDQLPDDLPDEVEVVLYRIAQEAIRNAQKHADAQTVSVHLSRCDGATSLRIADDGVGFATAGAEHSPGHVGLPSMRERADMTGGHLQLESAPGAGCVIEVRVPDSASAFAESSRRAAAS